MTQDLDTSRWCDCHAHVFGPREAYPLAPGADYSPPRAEWPAYAEMLDRLGIGRGVLVQPSVYGTDNRYLLSALSGLGERVRGVAVINPHMSRDELEALHQAGVRGVRLNALADPDALGFMEVLAERIRPFGWHLQLLLPRGGLSAYQRRLYEVPVPLVLDHFAGFAPGDGMKGQDDLLGLMLARDVWVKVSAPYLYGSCAHSDLDYYGELVAAVLSVRPDRLLWASDWPHPALREPGIDTDFFLSLLSRWIPGVDQRIQVARDNPTRLYGFAT